MQLVLCGLSTDSGGVRVACWWFIGVCSFRCMLLEMDMIRLGKGPEGSGGGGRSARLTREAIEAMLMRESRTATSGAVVSKSHEELVSILRHISKSAAYAVLKDWGAGGEGSACGLVVGENGTDVGRRTMELLREVLVGRLMVVNQSENADAESLDLLQQLVSVLDELLCGVVLSSTDA